MKHKKLTFLGYFWAATVTGVGFWVPQSMAFRVTEVVISEPYPLWVIGLAVLIVGLIGLTVYLWWLNRRLLHDRHDFNVLWQNTNNAITEVDADGVIRRLNHSFTAGLEPLNLLGGHFYDHLADCHKGEFREALKNAVCHDQESILELTVELGLEQRCLSCKVIPYITSFHKRHAWLLTTDISELTFSVMEAELQSQPQLNACISINDENVRRWFSQFFDGLGLKYDDAFQSEIKDTSEYGLLVTDNNTLLHAGHVWYLNSLDPGPEHSAIKAPFRREALSLDLLMLIIRGKTELCNPMGINASSRASEAIVDYDEKGQKQTAHEEFKSDGELEQKVESSGSLLVVEDNLTNQLVIKKTLEKMGYFVCVANNGAEGVQAFSTGLFQGVIMDIQMPVMDGLEATKKIRQLDKAYVPIIALTANAEDSVEKACFEAGMDAFLTKPINRVVLQSTLDKVLKGESSEH